MCRNQVDRRFLESIPGCLTCAGRTHPTLIQMSSQRLLPTLNPSFLTHLQKNRSFSYSLFSSNLCFKDVPHGLKLPDILHRQETLASKRCLWEGTAPGTQGPTGTMAESRAAPVPAPAATSNVADSRTALSPHSPLPAQARSRPGCRHPETLAGTSPRCEPPQHPREPAYHHPARAGRCYLSARDPLALRTSLRGPAPTRSPPRPQPARGRL